MTTQEVGHLVDKFRESLAFAAPELHDEKWEAFHARLLELVDGHGELEAIDSHPVELPDLAAILRTGVMALVYERTCPTCFAEPDAPCVEADGDGGVEVQDTPHATRYREMNGAGKSLVRAFGAMAEAAGLIAAGEPLDGEVTRE